MRYLSVRNLLVVGVSLLLACRNSEKRKYVFLHRNLLGTNDYLTYSDFIAVNNYKNGTMTTDEFYRAAVTYLDSVKAKRPVGSLTFLGENASEPQLYWDSEIWGTQRKYCIIGFIFSNNAEMYADSPRKVMGITIWKNAKTINFYWKEAQHGPFDSVLRSPAPLTNE
jgi:hypothetical protein